VRSTMTQRADALVSVQWTNRERLLIAASGGGLDYCSIAQKDGQSVSTGRGLQVVRPARYDMGGWLDMWCCRCGGRASLTPTKPRHRHELTCKALVARSSSTYSGTLILSLRTPCVVPRYLPLDLAVGLDKVVVAGRCLAARIMCRQRVHVLDHAEHNGLCGLAQRARL